MKVKETFVNKFSSAPNDKKPSPDKNDIVEVLAEISGRWPFSLKINQKVYYDVRNSPPEKIFDELNPLHSNSNYREDIFYKKTKDLVKSQSEKERLEVFQRNDRKLREKFYGKSKH